MLLLFVCGLMSLQTHLVYKCTLRRLYYNDSCTLILRNIFSIQLIFMHCEGGRAEGLLQPLCGNECGVNCVLY